MKKSKLKQIIREEYQNVTGNLLVEESIITKLLYLFLSPKVKKDIAKVKNNPEYIELERQAKLAAKELDAINKRLDRDYPKWKAKEAAAKKAGVPWSKSVDYYYNL